MAKKQQGLTAEEKLTQALVPESEQPYQVPVNWVWVRMEKILIRLTDGSHFSPKTLETGKPYITVKDISDGRIDFENCKRISNNDYQELWKNNCKPFEGDVLFSKDGTVGKVALIDYDIEFVVLSSLAIMTPNNRILLSAYLEKVLNSPQLLAMATNSKTGTAIRRIVLKDIAKLCIPLPPLAEQQRTVNRIESLFAKLDQAKGLIQEALDSFENRKAAILHQAFSGELTKKWREENGVGMESWEEKLLKEVCNISSGGTPSRQNEDYFKGIIPWVKTGEINWNYIDNTEEKISEKAIENSSAKLFPKGAVLVAMYGQGLTRGRAAILDVNATTNQAVCALIPKPVLFNKYLYYYFMTNYWDFREKAVGGNQPNLSGTIISGFKIDLPTIEEQTEIVRILDDLFAKEQNAKELYNSIGNIDFMKKAILARAFRGELGTNDPQEESALELLKDVLAH
jgi:type I restriction enzyme S subunit